MAQAAGFTVIRDGDVAVRSAFDQIATTDPGWERIQVAQTRRSVPVGEVITAIRSGTIRVRKRHGVSGYGSFEVLKGEIVLLRDEQAPASNIPAGSVSVAAFGKLIGIGGSGCFVAFVRAGHAGSFSHLNRRTGREQACMTAERVAAFHRNWLTVSLIATECGLSLQTVRAILKKNGTKPFSPDGTDYGNIYLRHEAEPLLPLPNISHTGKRSDE